MITIDIMIYLTIKFPTIFGMGTHEKRIIPHLKILFV